MTAQSPQTNRRTIGAMSDTKVSSWDTGEGGGPVFVSRRYGSLAFATSLVCKCGSATVPPKQTSECPRERMRRRGATWSVVANTR